MFSPLFFFVSTCSLIKHSSGYAHDFFFLLVRIFSIGIVEQYLACVLRRFVYHTYQGTAVLIMRPFFAFRQKKPLHNGSYEHRVPKIQNQTFFCTRDIICLFICVIKHRSWPLRSTILAHGTNASPHGLCTRRHTSRAVLL